MDYIKYNIKYLLKHAKTAEKQGNYRIADACFNTAIRIAQTLQQNPVLGNMDEPSFRQYIANMYQNITMEIQNLQQQINLLKQQVNNVGPQGSPQGQNLNNITGYDFSNVANSGYGSNINTTPGSSVN